MGHQRSESHEVDELLVQAQKADAVGRLAPGVTHELNNSLAAIVAFGQLLGSDERLPEELRQDADLLLAEADRTRRLVQDLLDFLRQRPPERHPTKLGPLVASVLHLEAYALSSAGIAVDVDIPAALPAVPLDRAAMQQVLLNLTFDAIAARSAGGAARLAITATETKLNGEPAVRLEVADTARHGQADAPDTLASRVSAAIVAAHGGVLADQPGPDGTGRARVVTLPVRPEVAEPARVRGRRANAAAEQRQSGKAVLVIDDEPAIREFVARALGRAGYEPLLAGEGTQAVEHARTNDLAAVLCDYRLPAMTGKEVHDALLAVRPELRGRIAFMTGNILDPDFSEFVRDQDLAILAKPFGIDAVRAIVEEITRGGRHALDAPDQSRG